MRIMFVGGVSFLYCFHVSDLFTKYIYKKSKFRVFHYALLVCCVVLLDTILNRLTL